MKKFTIDRKLWLRGEGSTKSKLFRPGDGKKCCVGFYANSLGLTDERINNKSTLAQVSASASNWAVSPDMDELYVSNDNPSTSDEFKEYRIKDLFAKHGIKVEFVN